MLRFWNTDQPCNRRDFMRIGALGLGGLSLADLFRLQASETRVRANDKAIILLWVGGYLMTSFGVRLPKLDVRRGEGQARAWATRLADTVVA